MGCGLFWTTSEPVEVVGVGVGVRVVWGLH